MKKITLITALFVIHSVFSQTIAPAANETSEDVVASDNSWPVAKFYFSISIGSIESPVAFQEVSGLDTTQPIVYRPGAYLPWSTIKMPEIVKSGNITLKKGIFVNDNNFWKWYEAIKMNTLKRETVVIQLLDQGGNPTVSWTLLNARPTKIIMTNMKSDTNKVAVETLELTHEGLTIKNEE